MPSCGFCGDAGVTKEHLRPKWLIEVILSSRAMGGMKSFQMELERGGETSSFKNPTLQMTVGMPCGRCNGGWMSELESVVKPSMTDMVYQGEKTLLDEERKRSLIRWIVKFAMVNEFTGAPNEEKYFTEDERRAFKERFEIPSNLWIWLGRYDGPRPAHALQYRGKAGLGAVPQVYSLTATANFLVMQVFAYRDSADDLSRFPRATKSERLIQLYPLQDSLIVWPPPVTIDDDALVPLDNRFVDVLKAAAENAPT